MAYEYEWPQTSPCSAVLIYTRKGNEVSLLTTVRDASVGVGRSLSAGGFYEVKPMFNKESGFMQDGRLEIYREMYEELGDELKQILPYEEFAAKVEHLWDGMVGTPDEQIVHNVTFRTVEVSEEQMDAIMALPSTSEQVGKKIETFTLNDDRSEPVDSALNAKLVEKALTDFKYPHEVEAAKMWINREETRAKGRSGSTGPGW